MTKMNKEQIEAFDCKRASLHEASHAIVAFHFGVPSSVSIWAATEVFNLYSEKSVHGQTGFLGYLTPYRQSVVGWAGEVSGVFDESEAGDAAWETFEDYISGDLSETMSATDLYCIRSTPFLWRACKNAADILQKRWEEVQAVASNLEKQYKEKKAAFVPVGWKVPPRPPIPDRSFGDSL